jgi:hypothetical protein
MLNDVVRENSFRFGTARVTPLPRNEEREQLKAPKEEVGKSSEIQEEDVTDDVNSFSENEDAEQRLSKLEKDESLVDLTE